MNLTSLAVSSCSSDLPCTEEQVTRISVVALLHPLPLLFVHWPVFLVVVVGDAVNHLIIARMDVPSWKSHTTWVTSFGCKYNFMLLRVARTLEICKTSQESAWKDESRAMVSGHRKQSHYKQSHYFIWVVFLVASALHLLSFPIFLKSRSNWFSVTVASWLDRLICRKWDWPGVTLWWPCVPSIFLSSVYDCV